MMHNKKKQLDKKGVEYMVPIHRILNNNFSPNNEFHMIEQYCTIIITVRPKLQSINPHSSHIHHHYCASSIIIDTNTWPWFGLTIKLIRILWTKILNTNFIFLIFCHGEMLFLMLGQTMILIPLWKAILHWILINASRDNQFNRWLMG